MAAIRDGAQNSRDAYRMTRLGVETLTSGCAVKGDTVSSVGKPH